PVALSSLMLPSPPRSTLFSLHDALPILGQWRKGIDAVAACPNVWAKLGGLGMPRTGFGWEQRGKPIGSEELAAAMQPVLGYCIEDRKSTRLNSSHVAISYAVFCLKKKNT